MKFNVSYAVVTPESAEAGDYAETGMVDTGLSLRDALKVLFSTRTAAVDGIEAVEANCTHYKQAGILECCPHATVYNGMEYETGACENRSMSPAGPITAASWRRVLRLIRVI